MKRSTSLEKAARVGGPAKGAGHGGGAKGSWPPFEPGNDVAVKHGSYAVLQLRPRADQIGTRLAEAMGNSFEPKYAAAVEAAALAAARVEKAMGGVLLEDADDEQFLRLSQDARGWLRLYLTTLERLGLTPTLGNDGTPGPVTLVIATAFPGVRHTDVIELEAVEMPALEEGDET